MVERPERRRILCVRPRLNPHASSMLNATANEWVEALSLHGDVTVVDTDFDLGEVCEQVHPDLVICDAVHWGRPWPLAIRNARACPEIPRVLFLNSDPHDPMRPLTFKMVEDLGIADVFCSNDVYLRHMPELRHLNVFRAPHFVDGSIYRDYGLEKTIPVSVFGGHFASSFYPWRAQAVVEMQHVFPTLVYPHPGYHKDQVDPFAVSGESYARLLNQSWFSLADTTRLDYTVRKHIEIPASGCVLIAPETDALHGYGFVDLENCILGSGSELIDKVAAVARAPDLYERIRMSGMRLVEGRYTRRRWTAMLEWLECRLSLEQGHVVRQIGGTGAFVAEPVRVVPGSAVNRPDLDNGMTSALRFARSAILTGERLTEAQARLEEAESWMGHIAEPGFLIGIIVLLRGDPVAAAVAISRRSQGQGAIDPNLALMDPVEIAWLLMIAYIVGNIGLVRAITELAQGVHHAALRRMSLLLGEPLAGSDVATIADVDRRPSDRLSQHWLGQEDFATWCGLMHRVLTVNDRNEVTAVLLRNLAGVS